MQLCLKWKRRKREKGRERNTAAWLDWRSERGSDGLGFGEEGIEIGEHLRRIPLLEADELASNFAVAINDKGFGIRGRAIVERNGRNGAVSGGIAVGGINHVFGAQEAFIGGSVLIGADAEDKSIAARYVFL